jgi:hypothetical protein
LFPVEQLAAALGHAARPRLDVVDELLHEELARRSQQRDAEDERSESRIHEVGGRARPKGVSAVRRRDANTEPTFEPYLARRYDPGGSS